MQQLIRSNASMTISFGGENEIDAHLLRNSIDDIILLLEKSRDAVCPGSELSIRIASIRPGSFEFDVQAIIAALPIIPEAIKTSVLVIQGFVGFFQLKKVLMGEKPQQIETTGDENVIIHGRDNSVSVNKEIYAKYTQTDVQINVTNIFNNMHEDDSRTDLRIRSEDIHETFFREDFSKLSKTEPFVCERCECNTSEETTDLYLRSPDFIGRAKWSFKHMGRTISASILDEDFLKKVRDREVQFQAGDRMPVIMQTTWDTNEEGDIVGEAKYSITKVTGEVKHVQKRDQNSIFE